jgi:hypothetical protein
MGDPARSPPADRAIIASMATRAKTAKKAPAKKASAKKTPAKKAAAKKTPAKKAAAKKKTARILLPSGATGDEGTKPKPRKGRG